MVSEKIQRVGVATNFKFAIGFIVIGIILLIISIAKFSAFNVKYGIAVPIIMVVVSLFLIIFGVWGFKKLRNKI